MEAFETMHFPFGAYAVNADKYTQQEAINLFLDLHPNLQGRQELVVAFRTWCRAKYGRKHKKNNPLYMLCLISDRGSFPVWMVLTKREAQKDEL